MAAVGAANVAPSGTGVLWQMIQVAFAGHNRPHDLGRHGPVITGLDAAFSMIKAAGGATGVGAWALGREGGGRLGAGAVDSQAASRRRAPEASSRR